MRNGWWLLALTSAAWGGAPVAWELYPAGAGYYNYAPATVEEGQQQHHFWWCQNTDPGRVRDHLYYRSFDFAAGGWSPRQLALGPGAAGQWDSLHVCDPSVVRGSFQWQGQPLPWLLAYLGCDQPTNLNNRIGLAAASAPGGPYQRVGPQPLLSGLAERWGVGQPSLVNLDGQAQLAVFYTQQEANQSTATWLRLADCRDLAKITLGPPLAVPTAGLTERDGAAVVLHDADFALDPASNTLWMVRPLAPGALNLKGQAVRLASVLQVARADFAAIQAGTGRWTVVAEVGPEQTGAAFAHSPSLGRDPLGRRAGPLLRLNFAAAARSLEPLWSYTLHGWILPLP
ncbi:MAG: hypothetical protein IT204_01210 [Fimbriimonadaceae bacterium]|nr:hypothetical protein [Fimbriimonadaceae bacterium]